MTHLAAVVRRNAGGLLLVALLLGPTAGAATRVDLDGAWQFRVDPDGIGEAAGWAKQGLPDSESVSIPHTWNVGRWHDYRGVAWYSRTFERPPVGRDGHVELHFGATFYRARIWLNGTEIGRHEGGFTAYSLDISRALKRSNLLIVELDNRPALDTIPGFGARDTPTSWYDWWDYGGIVRDVWMTASGPVWVQREWIRAEPKGTGAVVRARMLVESDQPAKARITLRATVVDPDGRAVASGALTAALHRGATELPLELWLPAAKLWGIDHPAIYRLDVAIEDPNGGMLDAATDSFGVRLIEIRDRHLLINGERVRLTGIARHEDSPWEGLAETRGTIEQDYDDMKALQTTLTRPVHYPQHPRVLEYADRHGIVLMPEIPVWQFNEAQLSNPRVLELAKQQMREMIEQAGNHPSVFAWSVMNESAAGTPGGIAYFRAMRDFIHAMDPGRYVSFADDNLPKLERAEQSAANDADFLLMNQYFGSWHGPASELQPALDKVNRLFPDKMVIISEMGYAGIFAKDPVAADEARIATIREQLPVLGSRDWIAGAILWCYQDYKSPRNLWPGQSEGFVEHGLVDEHRQRKPSYAVWRELNAPARLDATWSRTPAGDVIGFSASVTPNGVATLPSYPLHDYRLTWSVVDEKAKVLVLGERSYQELDRADVITGALPAPAGARSLRLLLRLLRPTGGIAAEHELDLRNGAQR